MSSYALYVMQFTLNTTCRFRMDLLKLFIYFAILGTNLYVLVF